MAMTINHTTMRTADVVFLRRAADPRVNVRFVVDGLVAALNMDTDDPLSPFVIPKTGVCNDAIADDSVRQNSDLQDELIDNEQVYCTVFSPFNLGWLTCQICFDFTKTFRSFDRLITTT